MTTNKSHNLCQGLLTFWVANDGGGLYCADSVGFGGRGTLTNFGFTSTSGWSIGTNGSNLILDGTDDYVRGLKIINIQRTTISVWVYITANPITQKAFVAGFLNGVDSDVNDKDIFIGTDGKPTFFVFDGGAKTTSAASSALTLNVWNHIVGTANGITAICYVNGIQVGSVAAGNTYTAYNAANQFISGRMSPTLLNGTYLNGRVNNIMFYNRALSATEVKQLYTNPYAMFQSK